MSRFDPRVVAFVLASAAALSPALGASGSDEARELVTAFQQQVIPCWDPSASMGPTAPVVVLEVHLTVDGHLASPPELTSKLDTTDPHVQAAVKQATDAISACAPYKLPAENYSMWRDIVIVFDPRVP